MRDLSAYSSRETFKVKSACAPRLRVLAVTDGEDTSEDPPLRALEMLIEHRVVLDVVVLGTSYHIPRWTRQS